MTMYHVWVATVSFLDSGPYVMQVFDNRPNARKFLADHGAPVDPDEWARYQGNQHRLTNFFAYEGSKRYRIRKKKVRTE